MAIFVGIGPTMTIPLVTAKAPEAAIEENLNPIEAIFMTIFSSLALAPKKKASMPKPP